MSRGPLLPWTVGNSWTYRVTEDSTVTTKRTSVGAPELVGGSGPNKDKMANLVITHKDDTGDGVDLDETRSWQALEGERVVRYPRTVVQPQHQAARSSRSSGTRTSCTSTAPRHTWR